MSITEFASLDPDRVDAVPNGATGIEWLVLKSSPVDKEVLDTAQRRTMARDGVAMPDGAFPIPDEGHLRSAIGRLAEYKGDKAKAKAHIIERAKALNLVHMLPKEWHVTKDNQSPSLLDQTREVTPDSESGLSDVEPKHGKPSEGVYHQPTPPLHEGQGDTAPNKEVPTHEALSQTAEKQEVNGEGSIDPDGEEQDAKAKEEAARQTESLHKTSGKGKNVPGSSAWEKKDSELIEQAIRLLREVDAREKAEDGAAHKAGRRLSAKTTDAIRLLAQHCQELLDDVPKSPNPKEKEMDEDKLIKLLGEHEKARQRAQKKELKKQVAKATEHLQTLGNEGGLSKKEAKALKKAAKAPSVEKLAKTLGDLGSTLEQVQKQVETISNETGQRIFLNQTGLTKEAFRAIPRGVGSEDSAFKSLEERIATARTPEEARTLRKELAVGKMVASERARAERPALGLTRFGPGAVPLLASSGRLGDDPTIHEI